MTGATSTPAALVQEGQAYAAAHLGNLYQGRATAQDLATLVQYLNGPMLEGFCLALHTALLRGAAGH